MGVCSLGSYLVVPEDEGHGRDEVYKSCNGKELGSSLDC